MVEVSEGADRVGEGDEEDLRWSLCLSALLRPSPALLCSAATFVCCTPFLPCNRLPSLLHGAAAVAERALAADGDDPMSACGKTVAV